MKVSVTTRSTAAQIPEMLEWDTEFWGLRVARANGVPFDNSLSQWAVDNTVGLMCLLVDADRPEQAQKAEEQGYRYMDTRVTLERQTASFGSGARLARIEDLAVLMKIAHSSHRITRFYADSRLPDERCDELYEEWIRRSFAGWADIVLVSDRDDKAVGYITVHLNGETASIGLIAVAEDARNKGVGAELVSSAVNWSKGQGAKKMSVVTQGRNVDAQRLFQRCGFQTTQTQLWFHRWYDA